MSEATCIKTLDELMVLFKLYHEDYNLVDDALEIVAAYKKAHPEHPITASLSHYLEMTGRL